MKQSLSLALLLLLCLGAAYLLPQSKAEAGLMQSRCEKPVRTYVYIALENPTDGSLFFPRKMEKQWVLDHIYRSKGFPMNNAGKRVFPGGNATKSVMDEAARKGSNPLTQAARREALREFTEETGIQHLEEYADADRAMDLSACAANPKGNASYYIFAYKLKSDRIAAFEKDLLQNFTDMHAALNPPPADGSVLATAIGDQELDKDFLDFLDPFAIISDVLSDDERDWFLDYAAQRVALEQSPEPSSYDDEYESMLRKVLGSPTKDLVKFPEFAHL